MQNESKEIFLGVFNISLIKIFLVFLLQGLDDIDDEEKGNIQTQNKTTNRLDMDERTNRLEKK